MQRKWRVPGSEPGHWEGDNLRISQSQSPLQDRCHAHSTEEETESQRSEAVAVSPSWGVGTGVHTDSWRLLPTRTPSAMAWDAETDALFLYNVILFSRACTSSPPLEVSGAPRTGGQPTRNHHSLTREQHSLP